MTSEFKTLPPKHLKGDTFITEKVKKGHVLFGEIRKSTINNSRVFWLLKKPDDIYLPENAWAYDSGLLTFLKSKKIDLIGVLVSNGDKYLTRMALFDDEQKFKRPARTPGRQSKFGPHQKALPIPYFSCDIAPPEGTMTLMKPKGR